MVEWGITEGDVLSRLFIGRRRSRYFSCRIKLWQHLHFPGSILYKTCVGGPWIEGEKYDDILDVLGVALLRKNCMKLWRTEPVSLEVTEDSTIFVFTLIVRYRRFHFLFLCWCEGTQTNLVFPCSMIRQFAQQEDNNKSNSNNNVLVYPSYSLSLCP